MNKNTFVKFSLTLVSATVLAACSSGGNSNGNNAQPNTTQQPIKNEEQVKATQEVGHKFVQKNESNLNVGTGTKTNNHASVSTTSMTLDLEPSLDTILVGIPLDKNGKARIDAPQGYLEDFDFRKDTAELNEANKKGSTVLKHIYIGQNTQNGDARTGGETLTKTDKKGTEQGIVYVYEDGRLNYTDYAGDEVYDNKQKRTQANLKDSVAEVYGYRTFAEGNSETDEKIKEASLKNAPFTHLTVSEINGKKVESYEGGQLKNVQYGRVTSSLHAADLNNFKDGKKLGDYGTKVVGFGKYGDKNTENHYFYRGIDDTKYSKTLAEDLSKHYFGSNKAEGKLAYQGHAVTYGINHKFNSTDGIPNAIGYKQELVSGTHVVAEIDLATKSVTGNLYDVWRYGNRRDDASLQEQDFNVKKVELVNFEGKLANNGSIAGTSVRKEDSDKGTFNANLFTSTAQELGGVVRSNNESQQNKQWGAVFGAKVQNSAYVAPPVVEQPPVGGGSEPEIPAWGESTDQKDKSSPNK